MVYYLSLMSNPPRALGSRLHIPIGSAGVHEWLPRGSSRTVALRTILCSVGKRSACTHLLGRCNSRRSTSRNNGLRAWSRIAISKLFSKIESATSHCGIARWTSHEPFTKEVSSRLNGVFVGPKGTAAFMLGSPISALPMQNKPLN